MKRVCAWCGKELTPPAAEPVPADEVSHGMCDECAHHLFAQLGMPLVEYLDGIQAPIMIVDPDGRVQAANRQASTFLQKDPQAMEGELGGDVFECAYSTLPGGCGNTKYCSGCTIRGAVTETLETGHSLERVPVILNRRAGREIVEVPMLISTEKAGDVVLLRVDQ